MHLYMFWIAKIVELSYNDSSSFFNNILIEVLIKNLFILLITTWRRVSGETTTKTSECKIPAFNNEFILNRK